MTRIDRPLLWISFLFFALAARAEDPVAVLVSLGGDVSVARSDGSVEGGSFGLQLHAGDEVRTGPDSHADLLFSGGQSVALGPASSMRMQGIDQSEDSSGGAPSPGRFGSVQRYLQLREARGTSSVAQLRAGGGGAELRALAPCQSAVRDPRPRFQWDAPEALGEVELTVYGPDGEHWSGAAGAEGMFRYPEDAPRLLPGVRYSWTVESTDPLQIPSLRSRAAYFEVVDDAQAKGLAAALEDIEALELSASGSGMLMASVYYEHGFLSAAIEHTEKLIEADAGDPAIRSILAQLYVEAGRVEDALVQLDQLVAPR